MAQLAASGIADLVNATLPNFPKLKFTDIISTYQNTQVLKRLMNKKKMMMQAGVDAIKFQLATDENHSFRWVGMYATDIFNSDDTLQQGSVPWAHATWNCVWDYKELLMNGNPLTIVNNMKLKRIRMFASAVIALERQFWRLRALADTLTMLGVPNWIVKTATDAATDATNDGFNGTTPSGWTTVGGLTPGSAALGNKWNNYADAYANVTKDDLIRKMRRAAAKTDFQPIVDNIPTYNKGKDYEIMTNYKVYGPMVEALEAQNENLGNDIASKEGKVTFMGTPVNYVRELDKDTTDPVFGVDFGEFGFVGLEGAWMKTWTIPMIAGQHSVAAEGNDLTVNLVCTNRRKQWVVSNGTTNIT